MSSLANSDAVDKPRPPNPVMDALIASLRLERVAEHLAWDAHQEQYDRVPAERKATYRLAAIVAVRLSDPEVAWLGAAKQGACEELVERGCYRDAPTRTGVRCQVAEIVEAVLARLSGAEPLSPDDARRLVDPSHVLAWLREGR